MIAVEWRPVVGFPAYEVSDLGGVRKDGRPLTLSDNNGYRYVWLRTSSGRKFCAVHRLVIEAFGGPRPVGSVCRHLDSNRANNRADNLVWHEGWAVRHPRRSATHGKRRDLLLYLVQHRPGILLGVAAEALGCTREYVGTLCRELGIDRVPTAGGYALYAVPAAVSA